LITEANSHFILYNSYYKR